MRKETGGGLPGGAASKTMLGNFHQVDNQIWRSARPVITDYVQIKGQFKSVLSLEGHAENDKEAVGLKPLLVIAETISPWEIYISGISQTRLTAILKAIADAPKPALLHCEHGRDRTGLIVACYRVMSGWDKNKAMAEALHLGYRRISFGLNRTWEGFQWPSTTS